MSMTPPIEEIARGLTDKQRRLLLAMPLNRPKKWRALYRHAKLDVAGPDFAQLPFGLAHPTLTGFEVLTPLGLALRTHLQSRQP